MSLKGTAVYDSRYPSARNVKILWSSAVSSIFDIFSAELYGRGGKVNDGDNQSTREQKILEQPLDSYRGRKK